MKYIKTYEGVIADIMNKVSDPKYSQTVFKSADDVLTIIIEEAFKYVIKNNLSFYCTQNYMNLYLSENGKYKRFLVWNILYFNNKKYELSGKQGAKLRHMITAIFGIHEKDTRQITYLDYFKSESEGEEAKLRFKVDDFWVNMANELGKDVVVKYITDRDTELFVRKIWKTQRTVLLPKTALMVVEESPSFYIKIKKYITPGLFKKVPDYVKRSVTANLWGMIKEAKEEEATEKELFLKYYSDLYIKKKYNELTIWKAYNDGFIDKEDAQKFINEYNFNDIYNMSDYFAIKFYLEGFLSKEKIMKKFTDLLIHDGKLKWYVEDIEDLPGVDDDSLLATVMDSKDILDHYYADYDIGDIWYHCSVEFKKELLEYCYNKEFEYDDEYILKSDMVIWKDRWRDQECYIKLGEEEVEFMNVINDGFSDIKDALEKALNRADENAYVRAFWEEGKRIIKQYFGDYEQIQHGKTQKGNVRYVYIFDPEFGEVADSIEIKADGDDDLMEDQYSTYNQVYSNTVLEDMKEKGQKDIDYGYDWKEGNGYYSIKNEEFEEYARECLEEEGIEKKEL